MIPQELHSPPRWSVVALEQIRAINLQMRSSALLLLALFSVVSIIVVPVAFRVRTTDVYGVPNLFADLTFRVESSLIFALLAGLVPFVVWQDEDPSRRSYHWTMPVTREEHSLIKVLAGWTFALAATAALLLGILVAGNIVARITGRAQVYELGFVWWEWLVPFTSASTLYLLVSAAVVGARRPLLWIGGTVLGYILLVLLLQWMSLSGLYGNALYISSGKYGLSAAVAGQVGEYDRSLRSSYPSIGRWLGSSVVWAGLAISLIFFAARRRTD